MGSAASFLGANLTAGAGTEPQICIDWPAECRAKFQDIYYWANYTARIFLVDGHLLASYHFSRASKEVLNQLI